MAAAEGKLKVRFLESYVTARNNFFHWVIKWFYKDPTVPEASEGEFRTPELASLVCLLHTIGFDLHRIEKLPLAGNEQEQPAGCTINITCEQSGMQAFLKPKFRAGTSCINNGGNTIRQGSVQDANVIASSLLPFTTPGITHVARDIISHLMQLLYGGEHNDAETQRACNSWTCPRTTPQQEIPPCQRRLSLETYFPIDSFAKSLQPQSLPLFSDVVQMDFEDNNAAVCGSNEPLFSNPQSPILYKSPAIQPELVRQKTWSIGSIHDLDDARVSMAGPTRTSSPLSTQQVMRNLEEMSIQARDPGVTERLQEACQKIQEALLMLNSSMDKNVPESGARSAPKLNKQPVNKQPVGSVPKLRPKTSTATTSANSISSNLRSAQRSGTLKRQRSPAPRLSHAGRKDLVTPKQVKLYGSATSRPVSNPPAPRKTQENEIRSGSFINISDARAGSPRLSPRAPSPASDQNISPTTDSRRSNTSRISFSSLPTTRGVSNLAGGSMTPGFGCVQKRKCSIIQNTASTSSAPATPITSLATGTPKAPREGSNSIRRPSLLKAPTIISRFKKQ